MCFAYVACKINKKKLTHGTDIVIVTIKVITDHTYEKVALMLAIGFTFFTLVGMGIYKAKVTGSSYWKSIVWTAVSVAIFIVFELILSVFVCVCE